MSHNDDNKAISSRHTGLDKVIKFTLFQQDMHNASKALMILVLRWLVPAREEDVCVCLMSE